MHLFRLHLRKKFKKYFKNVKIEFHGKLNINLYFYVYIYKSVFKRAEKIREKPTKPPNLKM